jgi:branched-chain amino acid transport system ATP-binding protein
VNLSVAKGEIVGLIGVNGSGKTTLFDICCGYNIPDSGHVFMDSHDVTGDPAHKRAAKGLGRVFQDARVFPSMTVSEVIAVALERLVEVRDPLLGGLNTVSSSESELAVKIRVEQLIEEFNLGKWRNSFVSELSIGTRRIVELTCIMAHQPDLLLLDEPSSGIAQRESEALGELLVSLRDRSGATFVIIEHDVPLVSSIADRLACLHLGTVITEGHPADVLNNPDVIVAYLGTDEDAIARSSSPLAQSSSSKSSV